LDSSDGIYIFDPGISYWKSAKIAFDIRRIWVWTGRADESGKIKKDPFKQWFPKRTKNFVIGFLLDLHKDWSKGWKWKHCLFKR